MKGFFDESSDDPREVACVVAGWVATVSEWDHFSNSWAIVMAADPKIDYFKHYEAKALKGQFSGWSEEDRDAKLRRLVNVLAAHNVTGYVATYAHKLYAAVVGGTSLTRKQLRSVFKRILSGPYPMCFHDIVSGVLQNQVSSGDKTQVDFVFDHRNGDLVKCISAYESWKGIAPTQNRVGTAMGEIAGTIIPGNDRELPPLQAADLLAGQITAYIRAGEPERPLAALLTRHKIFFMKVEERDVIWQRQAMQNTGLLSQ